jgi:hypothetical protein
LNIRSLESIISGAEVDDLLEEAKKDKKIKYGPMKRVLRKVDGKTQIVRKRKKALPLSMRTVSKAAAHRRAKKSAIKRKATQKKVTKKAVKTRKKAARMGLHKK